ncbi:MAG: glycosyltransferase family 4 protein [Bacteroidota bacterium]|nr:glycosyltransferase family 4 protein [Flavisolibacter sp.]MDQ3846193.1 glycosyltransferase family 4 protein [Bacteroidota bacterium]
MTDKSVPMKVLMIARGTLYSCPGGDTTQIKMTAKYLKSLGIDVDVRLSDEKIDYDNYHLIHYFNIIRPADILPHIKQSKVPFAVSTIFVDYREYETKYRKGLAGLASKLLSRDQTEYLKAIARSIKNGEKVKSRFYLLHGHKNSVRWVAQRAAILLPNSHNEYKRFSEWYKVSQRYQKVVNAIDPDHFHDNIKPDPRYAGHVLCVGRIEGLKNQLNLIKALATTDLQLTIIGKPSPNHIGYYEQCRKLAGQYKNITIINHINHDQLSAVYKAAKVHVLPSWFETTGLSSLEAAVMGCNIVITDKGDTKEYFGDHAYYCQPDDVDSIRTAVVKAYNDPVNPKLKEFILNNNTWMKAAQQTLAAYQSILKN